MFGINWCLAGCLFYAKLYHCFDEAKLKQCHGQRLAILYTRLHFLFPDMFQDKSILEIIQDPEGKLQNITAVCLYNIASFQEGFYGFIYLHLALRSHLKRSNSDKSFTWPSPSSIKFTKSLIFLRVSKKKIMIAMVFVYLVIDFYDVAFPFS